MKRAWCLTLLVGVFVTACQSIVWPPWAAQSSQPPVTIEDEAKLPPPAPVEPGLALSPQQRFPDIPLPMGAKEDVYATYVFQSSWLRVGRMVYTSRDKINDLAQFYLRECPAADWKLDRVFQVEGHMITFKKNKEQLVVKIRNRGMQRGAELVLELEPLEPPAP